MNQRKNLFVIGGLLIAFALGPIGCGSYGGMTQDEMKRRAIRRQKAHTQDDEQIAVEASSSTPASVHQEASVENAAGPAIGSDESSSETSSVQAAPPAIAEPNANDVSPSKSAPPLSAAEARARAVENLVRIGEALEKYAAKHGAYPAASVHYDGRPLLSWRVSLLPYLGYDELYQQFRLNEPWNSSHNQTLLKKIPEPYQSPERRDERTNLLAIVGSAYAFDRTRGRMPNQFEDGMPNTALVVEADDNLAVPWTAPNDFEPPAENAINGLGNLRQDGFLVLWGGGVVGWIRKDLSARQAYAMLSRAGGERFLYTDVHQDPATLMQSELAAAASDIQSGASSNRPPPQAESSSASEKKHSIAAVTTEASPSGSKWTVPDESEYHAVLATLRDIYGSQFQQASRNERLALANTLLMKAEQLNEPATRYVMLHVAAKIAAEAGDFLLAQRVIREIGEHFEIETMSLVADALRSASRATSANPAQLVEPALGIATQAMRQDDFETAREMMGIATAGARKAGDERRSFDVAQAKRRIDAAQRLHMEMLRSLQRLEKEPDNGAANTAVGRYYCFVKQEWLKGLPFLQKSDDRLLVEAATADLNVPVLPEECVDAADLWWSYGEANQHDRREAQLRAVYWYLRVPTATDGGLAAIKAEVRLRQAEQAFGSEAIQTLRTALAGD